MDESKSPGKPGKYSQPRGAKPSDKSNKELAPHREAAESGPRRQEHLNAAKDDYNLGSRRPGKTYTDSSQDKRRGRASRLTRLTGRTSSGERGKGKVASPQQQLALADELRASQSADSSPSAHREAGSPSAPSTPDRGPTQHAQSAGLSKEKLHGDFGGATLI